MKTKTIPFNLEKARKIQAGEIEGSIKTKKGLTCKIVSYCDGTDFFVERMTDESCFRWCYPYTKDGRYIDGKHDGGTDYDLVLEVQDNEHQFKPFDRVLVRDACCEIWRPDIFSFIEGSLYRCLRSDWHYCIPYDGNEHLVGKTDKPNEE